MSDTIGTPDELYCLIWFEDADVPPEIFTSRSAAEKRLEQLSSNWNAHLFVRTQCNFKDDSGVGLLDYKGAIRTAAEDMRERCAKVCEAESAIQMYRSVISSNVCQQLAAAIRALPVGEEQK